MDIEDRLVELSRKAAVSAGGIVDLAWELRDEIDAIAEIMRSRKAER